MPPPDRSPDTPSPEDKARVEALVADCIEAMERGERDPASRVCSTRPDLLSTVQRRLAHLRKRGLIPDTETMPATIGPYRLVRELGSGGMGSVYLAEQTAPVRRQVALKVVKLGMDTREVVARFHAERQALALMNHPHIAQVFDAGITAEGRPFFAMEYVAGRPLTVFADENRLVTERRVQVLAVACRAVQHAHDRGFIHRDLKPSNVLVAMHAGQFAPKIIDFGIAKATAAAVAAATMAAGMATRADQVLGTPEYMSPEQACSGGLDVDTRTDVYSLGVVLYELLCGELPFDSQRLRRASRTEMERILTEELPTQPSRRLAAADHAIVDARGTDLSTLQRRVTGELDWITLKAIDKDRERRYPSPLALAEDLERWLRHEPVLAAPPSRGYRVRKFVQRHRVAVAAATTVLVALVAGLVISLRATAEARAAQAKETKALADTRAFYGLARDAVGSLVDVADEGLAEVPQADTIRRRLLEDAMRFYESLRTREPDAAELRLDLADANLRVGVLQGRLGHTKAAIETLEQCARGVAALPPEVAATPRAALLRVEVCTSLAHMLSRAARPAEARARLDEALAALAAARASAHWIDDADLREARLLASLASETPDLAASIALFRRAMAAHARAGAGAPAQRRDRARCALLLAEALTKQNQLADAADLLADAATQLVDGDASAASRETEARVQMQSARVLRRLARFDEARVACQRVVDLRAALAAEHPDLPVHGEAQAEGLQFLAQLAVDRADPAAAAAFADRAIALREALVARHPDDHVFGKDLARALMTKAEACLERWQHHGASVDPVLATYERAAAVIDAVHASHPADTEVALTFAAVHEALASVHDGLGKVERARDERVLVRQTLENLLRARADQPDVHAQLANVCSQIVFAHYRAEEWDAAAAAGRAGLDHVDQALRLDARHRATHALVPQLVARVAAVHFARHDPATGTALLLRLVETPLFDDDAREWGALLLAEHALKDDTDRPRDEALQRAATELQRAIARRRDRPEDRARDAAREGYSHTASRQRDFDLHVVLADVHAELDDPDAQAEALDAAMRIAQSVPSLPADRRRNLFAQAAELALRRERPAVAEAHLETLLQQVGPDGGANALVAALLVQCLDATSAPADRERLGARAVQCLAAALDRGELSPAQAGSGTFAALRGRADYEALLRR